MDHGQVNLNLEKWTLVLCGCRAFWKNFRRTAIQTDMTYMRCIAKVVIGLNEHVDPDGKPWSEMYKRNYPQSVVLIFPIWELINIT